MSDDPTKTTLEELLDGLKHLEAEHKEFATKIVKLAIENKDPQALVLAILEELGKGTLQELAGDIGELLDDVKRGINELFGVKAEEPAPPAGDQ